MERHRDHEHETAEADRERHHQRQAPPQRVQPQQARRDQRHPAQPVGPALHPVEGVRGEREQARDIQVSAQVLDALARALLLDPSERAHLFALAAAPDPAPGTECPTVTPALRTMLEQLDPIPACVQNSRYDVLAYNRTYARLLCDLDAVAPEDRNCLLLAFTHDDWRASIVDLPEVTRMMAAKFRASMAGHLAEPAWKALLHRLETRSPEFREVWGRHEVVDQRGRTKYIRNAQVGLLHVEHTNLWLGPSSGPRLVSYPPVDEETRSRLERLHRIAVDADR
ncbi:XRE family transcriptional regulator [Streptomyces globisporus]|uniref:MmyB family transcriptional regulator n=1 Tax=Streptomyces globisporus TaxID=1908 RepID=UPI003702DED9